MKVSKTYTYEYTYEKTILFVICHFVADVVGPV